MVQLSKVMLLLARWLLFFPVAVYVTSFQIGVITIIIFSIDSSWVQHFLIGLISAGSAALAVLIGVLFSPVKHRLVLIISILVASTSWAVIYNFTWLHRLGNSLEATWFASAFLAGVVVSFYYLRAIKSTSGYAENS